MTLLRPMPDDREMNKLLQPLPALVGWRCDYCTRGGVLPSGHRAVVRRVRASHEAACKLDPWTWSPWAHYPAEMRRLQLARAVRGVTKNWPRGPERRRARRAAWWIAGMDDPRRELAALAMVAAVLLLLFGPWFH